MWNQKMVQINFFLQNRNNSHRYRKQTYGYQREKGEAINWEIWIDIYILVYIKQITNKNLLYSTGNSLQCSAMTYMGKDSKEEKMYIQRTDFAVQQKPTPHCKSTTLHPIKINF